MPAFIVCILCVIEIPGFHKTENTLQAGSVF
jgi:hypothetical protein